MLAPEERQRLLAIARQAIERRLQRVVASTAGTCDLPVSSGVFVTVRVSGELRGCLGTLAAVEDLGAETARCAADAATADPRFLPIEPHELPGMSIEISVLGPLERIDPRDPAAIRVGAHGLVVERGRRRGLLLPQVATQCGWTAEQFLEQTCAKARLSRDAWQRDAVVYRFTAEIFGD